MAFTGLSSLEKTNGRPLCPQCRAPMWCVRSQPETPAADRKTFKCPRCEMVVLQAAAVRNWA